MKVEDLLYFHAFLNQKLFGGKLEAVIIKTFDDSDPDNEEMIQAQIITSLDPFVIFIGESLLDEDPNDIENPIFTITVLLHEMIHQYNREHEIEDIDPDSFEHNELFRYAARHHGLIQSGYKMTDETRQMIEKQWKLYSYMKHNINWR